MPKPRKLKSPPLPPPPAKNLSPTNLGFIGVELLPDGKLQCICTWNDEVITREDLSNQFMTLANHLSNGALNRLFSNVAEDQGVCSNAKEFGYQLAAIFGSNDPTQLAMRPSDVFNQQNPHRAPFGVSGGGM